MDKAELLTVIREAHSTLVAAAAALDDEALLAPAPGLDGWTRKDVLAHVEWCNRHAADVIEGVRTGIDPYPGSSRRTGAGRSPTSGTVRRRRSSACSRPSSVPRTTSCSGRTRSHG